MNKQYTVLGKLAVEMREDMITHYEAEGYECTVVHDEIILTRKHEGKEKQKNEVFEYQLRQQVNNNRCEDLAHEVLSLKNQLRDASALVAGVYRWSTAYFDEKGKVFNVEQSGCRKEDAQLPVCSCIPAHCGTYYGDTVVEL